MHLAEEEVDEYRERPQDQIVQPPDEGRDVRLFLPHDDGAKEPEQSVSVLCKWWTTCQGGGVDMKFRISRYEL
jgi:hypothetical protein